MTRPRFQEYASTLVVHGCATPFPVVGVVTVGPGLSILTLDEDEWSTVDLKGECARGMLPWR